MMNEHDGGAVDRAGSIGSTEAAGEEAGPAEVPATKKGSGPWQDWVVTSDAKAQGDLAGGPSRTGAADQAAVDVEDPDHAKAVSRWRKQSTKRNKKSKRPFWVELPILILVAFVLTFLIQTFIAKVYYVPSGSMEKTLHGVSSGGDRILASKIVYDFRDPEPGDVVVFKGPDTWAAEADIPGPSTWFGKAMASVGSVIGIAPPNEKDFVKRVIAVGGQTVACCDAKGNVTVDGRSLNEPYIYEPWPFQAGVADCTTGGDDTRYGSQRCFAPYKIPEGYLWVMGDHRSNSSDSSFYCLGLQAVAAPPSCDRPIPANDVIGKAIFIVMPPSRWQTIGNPDIDPSATALGSGPTAALPVAGGLVLTLGLRGSLAMVPSRRRARRARKVARKLRP